MGAARCGYGGAWVGQRSPGGGPIRRRFMAKVS